MLVWAERKKIPPEVVIREMQISYPELRQIRVYAVPIGPGGFNEHSKSKVGTAIVMTDVTEEKDKLQEQIENERISSIMDLAAGVAHELGNPLNSIHIHLQYLHRSLNTDKSDSKKMDKSLATCIKEVQRLDGIIVTSKAIRPSEPSFQKINLLTVIEDTVRQGRKANKKIKVSMELELENQ